MIKAINYAGDILDSVGLSHKKNYYPSKLSGGERQRVAIARAIVNNPKLVLADEPTGNLDTNNTNSILQLFYQLKARHNTTFLVVTHDLYLANCMDRQLKMCDGWLNNT